MNRIRRPATPWLLSVLASLVAASVCGCGDAPYREVRAHRPPARERATVDREFSGGAGAERRPSPADMGFTDYGANPYTHTEDAGKDTFAVDVDTASYRLAARYIRAGGLPPEEGVRTEEFINSLDYGYPSPAKGELAICAEACPAPFHAGTHLLRVAVQARRVHPADRQPSNLVLVIDTSGSMGEKGKLDLVRRACRVLLRQLDGRDRVAVVRYDTQAHKVLGFTRADDGGAILHVIEKLAPDGRTSVQAGLMQGYALAGDAFDKGRVNRVILFSDGVANTDQTDADTILAYTQHWRKKGVTLTTVGVGFGEYNDTLLEQLADRGDGNYHYIDTPEQAERVLGREFTSTSQLAARDVKVQVEFDRDAVRRYRLMGYENRGLSEKDFRDRKVDGGDMGAGASVTALYAVELRAGAGMAGSPGAALATGKLATIAVRYRKPNGWWEHEIRSTVRVGDVAGSFQSASADTQLAATAAYFAEWLRDTYWSRRYALADVLALGRAVSVDAARQAARDELLGLIESAGRVSRPSRQEPDRDDQARRQWWRE